jgi:predicted Rossmann-fold nucleotide-binding protein
MAIDELTFQPIRSRLYTWQELLGGLDERDPRSIEQTTDFATYRFFVAKGGAAPASPFVSMMEALHDNSISQARGALLEGARVAGIMGGHRLSRTSPVYRDVARMARALARAGVLVTTGGGPGAMEAAHLGAALVDEPDDALDEALATLAAAPTLPHHLGELVRPDGSVDPALRAVVHRWWVTALKVLRGVRRPGRSLGVPTWHYGHEPFTPFASHIAKYFQNAVREDGLLAIAIQGVIYVEGSAGTVQEIFQDATQNKYLSYGVFSPMVLYGTRHWRERLPVVPVLRALFGPEDFARSVLVTDDWEAAVAFIEQARPGGARRAPRGARAAAASRRRSSRRGG